MKIIKRGNTEYYPVGERKWCQEISVEEVPKFIKMMIDTYGKELTIDEFYSKGIDIISKDNYNELDQDGWNTAIISMKKFLYKKYKKIN